MKTSCIIIDEPGTLALLKQYISKVSAFEFKGQFYNGGDAVSFLQNQRVDIIFIDIDKPGMSDLELAGVLPRDQKFIFITGPGKHALNNFPYHVIDYLPKPLSYINFTQTVEKIAASVEKQPVNIPIEINHLFVKSGSQMVRISFEDILYIKGEKEYVSLHFKKERLLIYKRMKDMESLLPSCFMRVHLSYIINKNYLVKVVANKHLFIGIEKIPIGGSYRNRIKNYIDLRAF
jgi:two-component system LytT family response regulator